MSTSVRAAKRSRTRRAGENAFGMLLLVKNLVMSLIVLVLVCAGGWASWNAVEPVLHADQRGTVRVAECARDDCAGVFRPRVVPARGAGSQGGDARKVTLGKSVSKEPGGSVRAAVRPGSDRAVRADAPGVLYACVPLAGALLLAALVLAGGLRMRRTAVLVGLSGAAEMAVTWGLLGF